MLTAVGGSLVPVGSGEAGRSSCVAGEAESGSSVAGNAVSGASVAGSAAVQDIMKDTNNTSANANGKILENNGTPKIM